MQSTAPNVDAYLAEVPAARRDVLTAIRQLCRDTLTGYEEGMDYGMPSYKRDGAIDVAFNSQKHYISIYVPVDVLAAHRDELAGASCGKSCIRYSKPEKVDLAAIERLLRTTATTNGRDAGRAS